MRRPEQALTHLLKKHGLTVAFAESMTCGLAAHKMGSVNGTSEVLSGAVICYTEEVKSGLLCIGQKLIDRYTCESQQVTDQLARNLRKLIPASAHAAITGLAAPGGSESRSKPVGTVFFALLFKNRLYRERKRFRGSPLEIKEKACAAFFRFISRQIRSAVQQKMNRHESAY